MGALLATVVLLKSAANSDSDNVLYPCSHGVFGGVAGAPGP
jgi:hypothetical protein